MTSHYQSYNYLCVFLLSHLTKKLIIVLAAATTSSSKRKGPTHVVDSGSDTNESTDLEESDSDSCDMEDESESENNIDEYLDHIKVLIATWKSLSPPVAKESVLGKWYAVVYSTKRTGQLFVSKIIKRFLVDENGAVDCLNVLCLKPKVGPSTLLDTLHVHSITFTGQMSV